MLAQHEAYAPNLSSGFCEEKYRLLDDFLDAVRELNLLHTQQTQAVIAGDREFTRFDILIFAAQEKKETAKYAWIAHIESHRCENELWRLHERKESAFQTIE